MKPLFFVVMSDYFSCAGNLPNPTTKFQIWWYPRHVTYNWPILTLGFRWRLSLVFPECSRQFLGDRCVKTLTAYCTQLMMPVCRPNVNKYIYMRFSIFCGNFKKLDIYDFYLSYIWPRASLAARNLLDRPQERTSLNVYLLVLLQHAFLKESRSSQNVLFCKRNIENWG